MVNLVIGIIVCGILSRGRSLLNSRIMFYAFTAPGWANLALIVYGRFFGD